MRKILIIFLVFWSSFLLAQNVTDGPYFLFEDSGVLLRYVLDGEVISQEFTLPAEGKLLIEPEGVAGSYEVSDEMPKIPEAVFRDVEKIFSLSDIHGQHQKFVEILTNNNVIDAEQNWIFGKGHLVVNGDVFDRGDQVTEALWLIKKLEAQALKSGGKVHLLLGNHEIAVLTGDDRYVNNKYITVAEKFGVEHASLYSNDTVLGRWLRTRNTCIRINDLLFVHGGISPQLLAAGIQPLACNAKVQKIFSSSSSQPELSEEDNLLLGSFGPFWYRGYFTSGSKYQQLHKQEALAILDQISADYIIVGHTTQDFINPFFGRRIIPIDTGIKYGDQGEGLLWKDGKFYRALADGFQEELD